MSRRWEMRRLVVGAGVLVWSMLMLATVEAAESGKVVEVTLYRGQALVTRVVPVEAPKGACEIVVGDLPEHVVAGSLFAEGSDGVQVRAVRYRTQAVGEEPRQQVRQLEEGIAEAQQKLELNRKQQELLNKQSGYLDQLEGFVAPTAKLELSRGVLDAQSLEKVTRFSFEQREQIIQHQVELQQEQKKLQEQLTLLERKRAELADAPSRTRREAVVFLEKSTNDAASLRLSYLVENCAWSPTYTFRADADGKQVSLEYNALIQQMTGEDWQQVELTLSTASPALSSAAPGLAPFPVTLVPAQPPQQQKAQGQRDLAAQAEQILSRKKSAISAFQSTLDPRSNIMSNWDANAAANEFQSLELIKPLSSWRDLNLQLSGAAEGPSISYRLGTPVSLASRSDQQMVRVAQADLPAKFRHVAIPLLTSYVYREAELVNSSGQDLLEGPVTVYLNGSFVGRSEIPTVAQGQTFIVGFGADPQLRARRELADKSDTVQGGNRELGFEYRLVVENYKDAPVTVSVFDRLPYTERTGDVRIRLGELKDPLSEDKMYVLHERPKGILRWDIEVPANATAENARVVRYSYTAEFDRTFQLTAARSDPRKLQQEFEELQRARLKH